MKVGDVLVVAANGIEHDATVVRTGLGRPNLGKTLVTSSGPDENIAVFEDDSIIPDNITPHLHIRDFLATRTPTPISTLAAYLLDAFPWVHPVDGWQVRRKKTQDILVGKLGPAHALEAGIGSDGSKPRLRMSLIATGNGSPVHSETVGVSDADIMGAVCVMAQEFRNAIAENPELQFAPFRFAPFKVAAFVFFDAARKRNFELGAGSLILMPPASLSFFAPPGQGFVSDPESLRIRPEWFHGWFHPDLPPEREDEFTLRIPVRTLLPTPDAPKGSTT